MSETRGELLGIDPNYQLLPELWDENYEALLIAARIFCMNAAEVDTHIDVDPPSIDGITLTDDPIEIPVTHLETEDTRIGPDRYVLMDQLPTVTDNSRNTFISPLRDGFQLLVSERDGADSDLRYEQYIFKYDSYNPISGTIYVGEHMDESGRIDAETLGKLTAFLREYEHWALVLWLEDRLAVLPEIQTTFQVPVQET